MERINMSRLAAIPSAPNTSVAQRVVHTDAGLAQLVLRVPAGIVFLAHGAQKLFGAFGGYGLEGTGQWMESIGLFPGYWMALLAGGAEFFGGLALILGLLVRPAALLLAITMVVAIVQVHLANGLFMAKNGFEFGLSLLAISIALLLAGGGGYSFDRLLDKKLADQS